MSSQIPHFYEFGPFCLDPSTPLLLREGRPVALTLKAVETLVVLIERGGRVVSREELIQAVWPDTFVEENNLSVNVSMLRKVLSQSETGEKYIETVSRRGYRFTASVRNIPVESVGLIDTGHTPSSMTVIEEMETSVQGEPEAVVAGNAPSAITEPASKRRLKTIHLLLALSLCLAAACVARIGFPGRNDLSRVTGIQVRSVAVLPLKPITINEVDEALSLGLADSLITRLGSSQKMVVRPLSSITKYAGTEYDALEVGRALQVDAIMEGSFQRANKRLRVTVRLLRVVDGTQLWAQAFEEIESDIFKLQDAISMEAASALTLNLSQSERTLILKRYTGNIEAYQAYLRGRYLIFRRDEDEENYHRAFAEYARALQLDPNYALAHAGLADAYSRRANVSSGDERRQFYEKAKAAALMALALDENLAEAHAALGWIRRIYDWDWAEAEKHMKHAIDLAPNEAAFRRSYVFLLITLGDTANAVTQARKALELDPTFNSNYAFALSSNRQVDEAIVEYTRTIELNNDQSAWHALAGLHLSRGDYVEAMQVINRAPQKEKERFRTKIIETMIYFHSGDKGKAEELLRELETQAKATDGRDVRLATLYASLGRKDEAIAALQKGFAKREDRLMWLKTNQHFDPLRDDPRFIEILRMMRL